MVDLKHARRCALLTLTSDHDGSEFLSFLESDDDDVDDDDLALGFFN